MNNYREEIVAARPPDPVIRTLGTLAGLAGMDYRRA